MINITPVDCKQILYQLAIGKLLYVAITSHPDIALTIMYLCWFTNAYNNLMELHLP
jgi:hypothetical protein